MKRTHRMVNFLREAGIEKLYFAVPTLFTHSKYLIKDHNEVALGTGNWLREDVEVHPQLYVHLKDPLLAKKPARHLDKQIRMTASLDLAPLMAQWIYQEFWTDIKGVTEAYILERFNEVQSADQIPITLIAFYNQKPAGTVSLIEHDDEERIHLKPWLAALYVIPELRNVGIGKTLVRQLLKDAQRLGIKNLYLGTDKPDFYLKLGAQMHEDPQQGLKILGFKL